MEEIKNTKRAERRKRTISKFKKRMKDVQVSGFKWMTEKAQTKIIKNDIVTGKQIGRAHV